MADRLDNVLDYATPPKRRSWPKGLTRRLIIYGFMVLAGYGFFHGPTSGQIRLDSGDLRYCWCGVPLWYKRMAEPERSKLMALASMSPAIPAKWVTCVTYPLPSSNNTDLMCSDFYYSVAVWKDEDPKIARWAMEDVADYIPHMLTRGGLPISCGLFFVVDHGAHRLEADWREKDDVKAYCAEHGYVPPSAPSASRP
jgi:hypothetical protein